MAATHNKGKGAGISFLRALIGHQGDECVIWPFFRNWNGYGHVGYLGTQHYAHRLMCELAHGKPPTPGHEASHSCGKGHEGCVHPGHLSWQTRSQNQSERRRHGTAATSRYGATGKLMLADRQAIRAMRGKRQKDIAAIYGVSVETISRILRKPERIRINNPFEPWEDEYVFKALAEGKKVPEIANKLGRTPQGVHSRIGRLRKIQERATA